jgi:hypothetical protein
MSLKFRPAQWFEVAEQCQRGERLDGVSRRIAEVVGARLEVIVRP